MSNYEHYDRRKLYGPMLIEQGWIVEREYGAVTERGKVIDLMPSALGIETQDGHHHILMGSHGTWHELTKPAEPTKEEQ